MSQCSTETKLMWCCIGAVICCCLSCCSMSMGGSKISNGLTTLSGGGVVQSKLDLIDEHMQKLDTTSSSDENMTPFKKIDDEYVHYEIYKIMKELHDLGEEDEDIKKEMEDKIRELEYSDFIEELWKIRETFEKFEDIQPLIQKLDEQMDKFESYDVILDEMNIFIQIDGEYIYNEIYKITKELMEFVEDDRKSREVIEVHYSEIDFEQFINSLHAFEIAFNHFENMSENVQTRWDIYDSIQEIRDAEGNQDLSPVENEQIYDLTIQMIDSMNEMRETEYVSELQEGLSDSANQKLMDYALDHPEHGEKLREFIGNISMEWNIRPSEDGSIQTFEELNAGSLQNAGETQTE